MDEIERFIRDHVTSDDVVIDVGANQGLYARVFAQLARQVYCLEPNPTVFPLLCRNVKARNVSLFQCAASDRVGAIEFYLDKRPNMGGVASSVNVLEDLHAQGMVEKVQVETTTIDRFCEVQGIEPTFIKVDVEGHEPALFRGARTTIERHQPILVFEFWETWWDKGFSTLFDELAADYRLIRVQDGADALRLYRKSRGDQGVDIAALPKRRLARARSTGPTKRAGTWLGWLRAIRMPDRALQAR
jgi:FkbM family methyltransferase